ncbi:GspE/PulE family protein [Ferriphaselus sp. R-1]|uniref:GspE/PulE family protein n=1 Tax=Ferriphaselus sp. R-1 TaxID=1485544 RepID=UPI001F260B72|nr:GspE/PulE family protein [Ferriphaselus sp. R-1]
MPSLPIGSQLLELGHISDEQLYLALQEQSRHHRPLGDLLVHLGFLAEDTLRNVLAERWGQQSVELDHIAIDQVALDLVPRELAARYQLLPLAADLGNRQLLVALSDPNDVVALDQLRAHLDDKFRISTRLASPSDLQRAIARHYGEPHSIEDLLRRIEPESPATAAPTTSSNDDSHPLVKLIDAMLVEAVRHAASDIHFEPESGFLRVRYRLDGVLRQMHHIHRSLWPTMLVRLKVMSGMNIAETRAPQDGHFSRTTSGHTIDFRAATHPTLHGENLVLRILDRQRGIVPLDQLGLDAEALATLHRIIAQPEGIVLVTGPTGSGKTTTLYSILSHINQASLNIMTLEDPVEYPIAQIRQTSLNETAKLDFASGIRSIMRQDPDIILVGEIRDQATAEMALRAAMTGHQVYATLHSNSAVGAIPRLLDLGILPDLLSGNLSGILAQRLVRVLCPHCKQPYSPGLAERQSLDLPPEHDAVIFRPTGCGHCQQQGYSGRRALMELLRLDDELDELIARRASPRTLKRLAQERGFRPLAQAARQQVAAGITSLAEVMRVVDLTARTA